MRAELRVEAVQEPGGGVDNWSLEVPGAFCHMAAEQPSHLTPNTVMTSSLSECFLGSWKWRSHCISLQKNSDKPSLASLSPQNDVAAAP